MGKVLLCLVLYWLIALLLSASIGFLAGCIGSEILTAFGLLNKRFFFFAPVGFTATFALGMLPHLFAKTIRYWSAYRDTLDLKKKPWTETTVFEVCPKGLYETETHQKLINILAVASVLAMRTGLGLPGVVKWRTHEAMSGWDEAALVIAAIISGYGIICGVRLVTPKAPGR
jgi:hypothetical protein